mgnify:CR=1 FL=1
MSRVAKKPITVGAGVSVAIDDRHVTVKGGKGSLSLALHPDVTVAQDGGTLTVHPVVSTVAAWAQAGTVRAVLNNMIRGVSQGFERRPAHSEYQVVASEDLPGPGDGVPHAPTDRVEGHSGAAAPFLHLGVERVGAGVVAEEEGTLGPLRQGGAGGELRQVHEVGQYRDEIRGHAVAAHRGVPDQVADGGVPHDPRVPGRNLLPGEDAVAEVDGGDPAEVEQRRHGLGVVVAVDHVGLPGQRLQPIHHDDAPVLQLVGHGAQHRAVGGRGMAAALQAEGRVAHPQFGAGAVAQAGIGEEDPHGPGGD